MEKFNGWDSPDFGEALREFFDAVAKRDEIEATQIERLHKSGRFVELTEKALTKYHSSKYRDKHFKRGSEPPEELLWFLLKYASVFGTEAPEEAFSDFTTEAYIIEGYQFERIDGQGSFVIVTKL